MVGFLIMCIFCHLSGFIHSSDVVCSLPSTVQLMKMMGSSDCADFKKKYLIPSVESSKHWNAPQMRSLVSHVYHKGLNKEVLNVGILGGSISVLWPTSLLSYLQLLFNYRSIIVHNGAIGGTGALVPAACLNKIFAKDAMDVIIIEFALNEAHYLALSMLVTQLRRRYGKDIPIIVLTLTSRDIKRKPEMMEERIEQHKQLVREYGLIHIDWSSLADKQYGKSYEPKEIWADRDLMHPTPIGNDWIALSVAATLFDIYQRNAESIADSTAVVVPPKLGEDILCISPYVCDEYGDSSDYNEHTKFGKCWYKTKKDTRKKCPKEVYEDDLSSHNCAKNPHENILKISFRVKAPCMLYFFSVGDGIDKQPHNCVLDIYDNKAFAKNVSFSNVHIKQYLHEGLLLSPNLHRIEFVPHNITGNKCSIGSIICI